MPRMGPPALARPAEKADLPDRESAKAAQTPSGARPTGTDNPRLRGLSRLLVAAEDRFLVPAIISPRAHLWVGTRDALTLPLLLRGNARAYQASIGDTEVRIVCVGREKRFAELLQRLFPERGEPAAGGTRLLSGPSPFRNPDTDLVAVTVHPWLASRYRAAGWTIIPDVVRWRGDLASVPPPAPHRSLRSDLRKAERYGYTLEVARNPADWYEFYEEMLLPQARNRFGMRGWTPSVHLRRRFATLGTLLFARRDGRRVAGACAVRRDQQTIWFPLVAVRNGDPILLREAAATAMLSLAFDWARELDFRCLDSGRSSPFLNDGVHASKRKWGLIPTPDPLAHLIAIRANPACEPLRDRLAAEPVLSVDRDGFRSTENPE